MKSSEAIEMLIERAASQGLPDAHKMTVELGIEGMLEETVAALSMHFGSSECISQLAGLVKLGALVGYYYAVRQQEKALGL